MKADSLTLKEIEEALDFWEREPESYLNVGAMLKYGKILACAVREVIEAETAGFACPTHQGILFPEHYRDSYSGEKKVRRHGQPCGMETGTTGDRDRCQSPLRRLIAFPWR